MRERERERERVEEGRETERKRKREGGVRWLTYMYSIGCIQLPRLLTIFNITNLLAVSEQALDQHGTLLPVRQWNSVLQSKHTNNGTRKKEGQGCLTLVT